MQKESKEQEPRCFCKASHEAKMMLLPQGCSGAAVARFPWGHGAGLNASPSK